MSRMTREDIAVCWEALEKVPRLPSYAERALAKLKWEMEQALTKEERLRDALIAVQDAIKDVDPGHYKF